MCFLVLLIRQIRQWHFHAHLLVDDKVLIFGLAKPSRLGCRFQILLDLRGIHIPVASAVALQVILSEFVVAAHQQECIIRVSTA